MRRLSLSSSLLVFLEELEFTEVALSSRDETKELACAYRDELESWERLFKTYRGARHAIIHADAIVAVRDQELDEITTKFGRALLAEVNGDRKSPLFRRFFADAPSEFVRKPLRKQCEYTLTRIVPELNQLPDGSPLKAFAKPLAEAAQRAIDALDARAKVVAERASVSIDVEEWKEGVNRLRMSTYAALLQIGNEKGNAKAFAKSFFRVGKTRRAKGGNADTAGDQ